METIPPDLARALIIVGRERDLTAPSCVEALLRVASKEEPRGWHWSHWNLVCDRLQDDDLLPLLRGLTIAATLPNWEFIGSSVADWRWVEPHARNRGPGISEADEDWMKAIQSLAHRSLQDGVYHVRA